MPLFNPSGSGTVTGVTAADTSIVIGGTASAPTIATGTLDVIAADHAPVAAVALNSQKITGQANGTAATDSAAFGQIPVFDSTTPAATSSAGAVGAAATIPRRDHVHAQNYGGIFGDGSDGSVTFDGSTTILGMVPAGNVYTMTRDIFCTAITINNGVTVKPVGYRIFCQGTVTNNGTISAVGGNGANAGTAGSGGGTGTLGGGKGGGAGATGGASNGTATTTPGAGPGGNGGTGGASGNGAAGTGGTSANSAATTTYKVNPTSSGVGAGGAIVAVAGGAGGGGGGGDGTTSGGGGGAGGGTVMIAAWAVNNGSGTITAAGGNGGSPSSGTNPAGGGGGGGGLILVYTLSAWTAGTTSVAGGNLGTGRGTGGNGQAGTSGLVLNQVLS